ncbi:VOC family protein [Thalassobacillus sp. B23F22_16]|uniref:VOC family protein n=1 Tax=Thalassobacillus sp. B23F22_16 TaxID=3459513 RepID=UPI00373F1666
MQKITPHLWFDTKAEEAAAFYVSIFNDSRINKVTRYLDEGQDIHGKAAGSVMTVDFELEGQSFMALNGGPHFQFSEAISFIVHCENQEEVDRFWEKLSDGGDEAAQQCGWLKDKYGVSWQIVPDRLPELLRHPEQEVAEQVMREMLQMKKININRLTRITEKYKA